MLQQGMPENSELYCLIWQDLLFNSLLMHSAQVDSVEVSNNEIEQEIDRRLQYFMMQMRGSEEEFKKNFQTIGFFTNIYKVVKYWISSFNIFWMKCQSPSH